MASGRIAGAPYLFALAHDLIRKVCNFSGSCSSGVTDTRSYPSRPILAVSAAIIRDGKVLIVRRARPPAAGLYTLPGGGVEVGETLFEAGRREVREETALEGQPVGLAGYRQAIS